MHPSPILYGIAIFRTFLFEEYLPFSFTLRIPPLAHVTRLVHKIGLPSSPLASPMRSLRPRPACLATKTSSTAMPAASLPSYLTQWPAPPRLRCQRPTLHSFLSSTWSIWSVVLCASFGFARVIVFSIEGRNLEITYWGLLGIIGNYSYTSSLLPSIIRFQLTITYRSVSATLLNWLLNALESRSADCQVCWDGVLTLVGHLINRKAAFFAIAFTRYVFCTGGP